MRRKRTQQLGLVTAPTDHVRARELVMMSRVLDALPGAVSAVHRDLVSVSGRVDTGREARRGCRCGRHRGEGSSPRAAPVADVHDVRGRGRDRADAVQGCIRGWMLRNGSIFDLAECDCVAA